MTEAMLHFMADPVPTGGWSNTQRKRAVPV